MENNLYDILRKLDHEQIILVIRDVLNKTEGLNLDFPDEKFDSSGGKPDLIHRAINENKVEIICDIKEDLFIDGDVGTFAKYGKVYPEVRFILVVLKKISQSKRKLFLDHRDLKEISYITLFDIDDIINRIDKIPDIRMKLLKSTESVPGPKFVSLKFDNNPEINERIGSFLNALKDRQVFLSDYIWGSQNKIDHFLSAGIWQSQDPNKNRDLINAIKRGDIIILKSVQERADKTYLTAKAVGIVTTFAINNGIPIVKWLKVSLNIPVPNSEIYYNSLLVLEKDQIQKTFEYITINDLNISAQLIKLFEETSIDISNSSTIQDKENIINLIKSLVEKNSKFWWLNTQRNIGQDIRTNSEVSLFPEPFSLENLPKGISEGEVVIANYQGNNDIWGLVQFSEYKADDGYAWFKLLFEFPKNINVNDLKSIPSFENAYNSFTPNKLYELSTDLLVEIINTTELGPLDQNDPSPPTEDEINEYIPPNISLIAPQISDSDIGPDYLDIKQDITAFAKIIASNTFTPPLAIALFGKWGTGKSFFMKKLRDKIDSLSSQNNRIYQTGISQIHFNAWSYLDSNLWASIVTKVFEGLYEYIGGDTKAKDYKDEIGEKLNEELSVLKDERQHLEQQKEINKQKIKELKTKEENAQEVLAGKIKEVREASLQVILEKVDSTFKVKDKIASALKSNSNVQTSSDEIKKIIPERYWDDPELALKEAKSTKTFIIEFFRKKNIEWNIICLLLIIVGIAIIPQLLDDLTPWLKNEFIVLPQVALTTVAILTPIWKRFKTTYDNLQPIISSFWEVKKDYDKAVEAALFTHNQHMESIKIEIDQKKTEVENIQTQISELNTEIEGLDYQLKNTISTQTLFSFIERRAKGDIYKKHLGIISTIRNDFEVLSELFNDSQEESKHAEFRKYFNKPLQRIVLYIDDLDRCPEDQVIEVLEAVNLLMAFPLFVVIVGVDPRWVKNALLKKYELQFNTDIIGDKSEKRFETIEVSNYLEKIFQVPFHLNKASDRAVKNMLRELSFTKKVVESDQEIDETNSQKKYTSFQPNDKPIGVNDEFELAGADVNPGNRDFSQQFRNLNIEEEKEEVEEHLALSDTEVELIQEMSGIIGANPRAIKRFVNVYHIVRAHEGLGTGPSKDSEYLCLMLLLALPMGPYKKLYNKFVEFIDNTNKVGESNFKVFLEKRTEEENEIEIELKKELDIIIQATGVVDKIEGLDSKTLSDKNRFIQRFTFSKIA